MAAQTSNPMAAAMNPMLTILAGNQAAQAVLLCTT